MADVQRAITRSPRPSRQEWPPILSQEIADAIAERERRLWWWDKPPASVRPLPPSVDWAPPMMVRDGEIITNPGDMVASSREA